MRNLLILLLSGIFLAVVGCDSPTSNNDNQVKEKNDDHDGGHHHAQGAHGGNVLDSGGKPHVEFVHNKEEGKVSLYILGGDGETPLEITETPILNLKTADGPKQIQTKMVNEDKSHYSASGTDFKKELNGRIAINFEGKRYNLDIETDHGHGHDDHGHDHPEHAISHTAWTEQCEWFVELETPERGKAAAFAAHVTLLKDFSPARTGSFTAKATSGSLTASANAEKPARDGIYTPHITFPQAGKWTLQLTYKSENISDTIEYQIEVYETGKIPHEDEEEDENAISFLKEQQWKIDFATAWSNQEIPSSAVLQDGGKTYVYVQLDGESFEKREVKVSKAVENKVKITEGLKGKERVVTKGTNAIK